MILKNKDKVTYVRIFIKFKYNFSIFQIFYQDFRTKISNAIINVFLYTQIFCFFFIFANFYGAITI